MKNKRLTALLLSAGLAALAPSTAAAPPSTAFTYQGSLAENGDPTSGPISMSFKLWDAVAGGNQVGSTLSSTVDVINGVFSESLDFGAGSFADNQALWLEILVEGQSLGRTPMNATPFALNTRGIAVSQDGKVGLGTDPTRARLEVNGRFRAVTDGNGNPFPTNGKGLEIYWSGSRGILSSYDRDSNTPMNISLAEFGGNVGVGVAVPGTKLEAAGAFRVIESSINSASGGAGLEMSYRNTTGGRISAFNRDTSTPRNLELNPFGGLVGIGTTTPATTLDVNGAVTIRGGADIVEGFDSICGTAFEPGTVLVIDPNNPGKLMCSEDAYDYKVAGVVSGANGVKPGIKLGQDGVMDGEIPVAMTGRVYVKCSAENGAIQPGDRLTTSSISGHAMKATDANLSDGAVIGKAMSSLDEATGMVLVLVNLQ